MILFRTSLILNWILQRGRGRGANRACDSGINLRQSCVYAYIIGHRNMSICVIMECSQLFCMYEYQPMQTLKQPSWTFRCPSQQRARHSSGRDWWDSSRGTDKSFTVPCSEPGQRSNVYGGTFTCGIPPPIIATCSIISIMQNRKEQVFFSMKSSQSEWHKMKIWWSIIFIVCLAVFYCFSSGIKWGTQRGIFESTAVSFTSNMSLAYVFICLLNSSISRFKTL